MKHIAQSVGESPSSTMRDVKRMVEGKFIGSDVISCYESGSVNESSYFIKEIPEVPVVPEIPENQKIGRYHGGYK